MLLPHPTNRDGHFEDADIVEAHDDLLTSVGRDWMYDAPDLPAVAPAGMQNLRRLAAERDRRDHVWGFKDPRVCLFLDAWEEVLVEPCVLVVFRDFRSCLTSLLNRAAWMVVRHPSTDAVRLWQDPSLPLRMWLQHNRALIDRARAQPERTLVLEQDALLEGETLIEKVNARFDLRLTTGLPTGVRPERQSAADVDLDGLDAGLTAELEETMRELRALAGRPGHPPAHPSSSRASSAALEVLAAHAPAPGADVRPAPSAPDPGSGPSLEEAEAAVNRGDAGAALEILSAVRDHDSPYPVWTLSGRAEAMLHHWVEAARCFGRAVEMAPDRPGPQIELARCYLRMGDPAAAAERLAGIEVEHPAAPAAPVLRCQALHRLGRHHEAAAVAERAMRRMPEAAPVVMARIHALHRSGHVETAARECLAAERRFPDNLGILELSAALQHQVGHAPQSESAARRAAIRVLADPDHGSRLREALAAIPDEPQRRDAEARAAAQLVRLITETEAHDAEDVR